MGTLADSGLLIQGTIGDGGAEDSVPEGTQWEWEFNLCDASGAPLDPTGLTCDAVVKTKPGGGALVLTLQTSITTVNSKTRLRIWAEQAATAGLAGSARAKTYFWSARLNDGTDPLFLWELSNSRLTVTTED